jgi:hypothetical protein
MYSQRSYLPATPKAWSTFIHLRQSNKCQHASKPCFHQFIALYTLYRPIHIVQVYFHKLVLAYFLCFFVSFPFVSILYCFFRCYCREPAETKWLVSGYLPLWLKRLKDMSLNPGRNRTWNANRQRVTTWGHIFYMGDPDVICPCLTLNTVCLAALRSLTCIVRPDIQYRGILLIRVDPYACAEQLE